MREYGLVVGPIALVGRAPDVGRQRHGTALVDRLIEHRPIKRNGERDFAVFALGFHGGIELTEKANLTLVPEPYDVAWCQPLGGFDESAPARAVEAPVQRRLDGGLRCAPAEAPAAQTGGNDFGIV